MTPCLIADWVQSPGLNLQACNRMGSGCFLIQKSVIIYSVLLTGNSPLGPLCWRGVPEHTFWASWMCALPTTDRLSMDWGGGGACCQLQQLYAAQVFPYVRLASFLNQLLNLRAARVSQGDGAGSESATMVGKATNFTGQSFSEHCRTQEWILSASFPSDWFQYLTVYHSTSQSPIGCYVKGSL